VGTAESRERESGREQREGERAAMRRRESDGRGRGDGEDGWDCGLLLLQFLDNQGVFFCKNAR
jgi:hypothetical protein